MRKALIAVLAFSLGAAWASPGNSQTDVLVQRLARLYGSSRFFDLRKALDELQDDPSIDVVFFRAAVDQVFNRSDLAISRLRGYIAATGNGPARSLIKESWVLLADAFRRLGRYREAAESWRELVDRFGPALDPEEKAACKSEIDLWSALAGVLPQEVEIAEDTTIRMTKRLFPVRVKDRTFLVGTDTGSNMSILYKSVADEMAIAVYGRPIRVQTATGETVEGRIGVVPEIFLGPILIKNAVFVILPDALFGPGETRGDRGRRGLLGTPILSALREFTETADGDLIIPASPRPRPERNMCFSGFMPVVEVRFRGNRLSLCLDTGSSATYLYPTFLRRYFGEINSRSSVRRSMVSSIGNFRAVAVRVLDTFAVQAGGRDLDLRRVQVHSQATHADSRRFHGTLGLDILAFCSRMTLNFESMSFVLE
jgi:hypothetical protein